MQLLLGKVCLYYLTLMSDEEELAGLQSVTAVASNTCQTYTINP